VITRMIATSPPLDRPQAIGDVRAAAEHDLMEHK